MAWLLETGGLKVDLLQGGYKAFRQWGREILAQPKPIITLGGMTGTGKTALLYVLQQKGEQILDLEGIAHHRGSSYGALGLPPQPTQEQFANDLAIGWAQLDADRPPPDHDEMAKRLVVVEDGLVGEVGGGLEPRNGGHERR